MNVALQVVALLLVLYFALDWFLPKQTKARRTFEFADKRYLSVFFAPIRRFTGRIPLRLPVDIAPFVYILAILILRSFVSWLMLRA